MELTKEEELIARNYQLLTRKPMIYVANMSEEDISDPENNAYYQKVSAYAKAENNEVIAISAEIEEELSSLAKADKEAFLQDLGILESGLDRLIRAAYHLLGLQTFFTAGKQEVRAWTFKKGMTAPECAGIIHTDFQKGFIRAETYSYEDLMVYRS